MMLRRVIALAVMFTSEVEKGTMYQLSEQHKLFDLVSLN